MVVVVGAVGNQVVAFGAAWRTGTASRVASLDMVRTMLVGVHVAADKETPLLVEVHKDKGRGVGLHVG